MKNTPLPTQNKTNTPNNQDISSFMTKLFLRAVIAAVLCMIVYLSIGFIFTSIGTKQIGNTVYVQEEDGSKTKVGDFYFDDVSELEASADANDAAVSDVSTDESEPEKIYYRQQIRSKMSTGLKVFSFILSEICMLGMYISMLYITAWERGEKARQNRKEVPVDKWYGLRGGLFATIPLLIAWAALIPSKLGWFNVNFAGTFQFIMAPWFPIVNSMMGSSVTTAVPWWAIFAALPLTMLKPLTTHVAYTLGVKDIILRDQILYGGKKKKKRKKKSRWA